ncbi:uncharacterized protein QC763_704435 [Podospora pseudopauciseta]|uniref:BSD domain-containing protein n=1 Tax=Podospora pseudopauciseta TaxID=2093780 RepID=A0ABR0H008_9PEZI|nr:hypothetical protein QC763_704435 [Podospora pseudopauciseta]
MRQVRHTSAQLAYYMTVSQATSFAGKEAVAAPDNESADWLDQTTTEVLKAAGSELGSAMKRLTKNAKKNKDHALEARVLSFPRTGVYHNILSSSELGIMWQQFYRQFDPLTLLAPDFEEPERMKDDARAVMAILREEEQEREWLKQDEEQTEEAGYWEIDGWIVSEEDQEEEETGGQEQGDARVVMGEPEEEDQEHAEAESGRGSKKEDSGIEICLANATYTNEPCPHRGW